MSETRHISFETLRDRILDAYYRAHPGEARWLGLHQFDGQVPLLDRTHLDARAVGVRGQIDALDAIPDAALDSEQRFDRDLLAGLLRTERFDLERLDARGRNPMVWADDIDVSGYLIRSYAPIEERADQLLEHARQIPRVLEAARAVLHARLARPVVETAIDVFQGTATFLRDDVIGALAAETPSVDSSVVLVAAESVDAFIAFLTERLEQAHDDVAIGPDLLSEMLRVGEMVDVPLDTLLGLAEADLERNLEEVRRIAGQVSPGTGPRALYARMGSDHPPADELIPATAALLDDLRRFVQERDVVSIPTDARCEVRETPPFLRWAFAMMDTAGPYEAPEVESYYYVTPPEPDWPAERREAWLTSFDNSTLPGISIHEAYPGHFVHFLHLRHVASPVRKVALSYSFIEGWAHYVEEMMLDVGYGEGEPFLRLAQLREALLRDCRMVVALRMHAYGMTVDEATALFAEKAFAEDEPARQEAVRGTFDPGYLNYTLGKLMLRKLRADVERYQGPAFSLRAFHDSVLALGAPPFPLARRALLPNEAGAVL